MLLNGTLEKRSTLGLRERIAIADCLKDKLQKLPGGFVIYKEAHSDRTVAEEMAFPCSDKNVSGVRLEMYGRLRDNHLARSDLDARIEVLEERVDVLEAHVEGLYARLGEPLPSQPL